MTIADATPDLEQVDHNDRAFLGHPKGLGYLGFTEACERFSYYSMQTLLVLYMVNYLLVPGRMDKVIGLEWLQQHVYHGISGQPLASAIFGTYTSLVYGTPILGGRVPSGGGAMWKSITQTPPDLSTATPLEIAAFTSAAEVTGPMPTAPCASASLATKFIGEACAAMMSRLTCAGEKRSGSLEKS